MLKKIYFPEELSSSSEHTISVTKDNWKNDFNKTIRKCNDLFIREVGYKANLSFSNLRTNIKNYITPLKRNGDEK